MLLRIGLEIADRLVNALPSRLAYPLADFAGDVWRRLSPGRRRLVEANLARVCGATGRPASGPAFRRLVRQAFRHHARYYLEILRGPHVPVDRIEDMVSVPDWDTYAPVLRGGPSILISWHLGNPEPFATYLARHGLRPLAPIEVIQPQALFEFLVARRGAGHPELVPLDRSVRPLTRRLREGGLVALVADRDIGGGGQPVTVFGHSTSLPTGPAFLAVTHRASLLVGRCLRAAPDHYVVAGELLTRPDTGDRRADVARLTELLARRLEADIAAAPEQWWGAFQPFWPDLHPGAATA